MFEKEAERKAIETCPSNLDMPTYVQGFVNGFKDGYNKANEWHYPSKGEYPELNKTCVAKYGKNIVVIEFVNECQFEMIEYWKYCDLPKEIGQI